eukprot:13207810-Ditylum_brightwellii.AAC.1
MVAAVQTTVETELSNSKLIDITIDIFNNIIKRTITGDTNEQDANKHDNKNKVTSDDDTHPTVSLSQTLADSAKDTQSESESDGEDEVEQLAQNKKKSETLVKAAFI